MTTTAPGVDRAPQDDAPDGDGRPVDWRARCKAAEDKVRLLKSLIDLLPDYFYVHDWDLRFQLTNRAGAELWGLTPEQMVGRTYAEIDANVEQAARVLDVCRKVMSGGAPERLDAFAFTTMHGDPRVFSQFNVPFRHPTTGAPMLLGLARDMTAEHELMRERLRRERLERDLEIAEQIQRSILPAMPPRLDGFEVAGVTAPSAYAAGDFYDWWQPATGGRDGMARSVVCLGDVTGHGIGPALLAAACRSYGRALLRAATDDLATDVDRLGRAIAGDLLDGRFITFAALTVDPAASGVSLVSAGHGPILHFAPRSDTLRVLDSHGLPLGIDPTIPYDPRTWLPLAAGDAVVVLSDGIPEATSPDGEPFGIDRINALVAGRRWATARELVDALIAATTEFCRCDRPTDDLTAVAILRTG